MILYYLEHLNSIYFHDLVGIGCKIYSLLLGSYQLGECQANPYQESVDGLYNRWDFNLVRGIYRLILRLPGEFVHFRRCKSIGH